MKIVWKPWQEEATLDTALKVDYLTALEKEIVLEHNRARSNPRRYAEQVLTRILQWIGKDKVIEVPGGDRIKTREGQRAVDEAIQELINREPVQLLHPSPGLTQAARDHLGYLENTGGTGHGGAMGSQPADRVQQYVSMDKKLGSFRTAENLGFGFNDAVLIVATLIIDDGVRSRGHRKNIFHPDFSRIGVAYGTHQTYRTSTVIEYTGGHEESGIS